MALSTSPGFDRLLSLDVVCNITPFPYQLKAVREVLRRMRGRAILADEVGLGKTIEAGLVMMEYVLRGLARRILILCPPSLVAQWQEELKTKFNMDFLSPDDRAFAAAHNPWAEVERIIASIDTAKNEANRKLIKDARFDLVIVDEAHRCRNRNTLNWKLVNDLKKKYILLLSAALRSLMREVMVRNRRETCGLTLPKRKPETVRVALTGEEARFYDEITAFVRARYNVGPGSGRSAAKAPKTRAERSETCSFATLWSTTISPGIRCESSSASAASTESARKMKFTFLTSPPMALWKPTFLIFSTRKSTCSSW